jgi:hypothetical protein
MCWRRLAILDLELKDVFCRSQKPREKVRYIHRRQ